jgi:hypothetical protein
MEETKQGFFTESKQKIEEYIQDRLLLFKLTTVDKLSRIIAGMFTWLLMVVFGFFILLFLSIMAGYYFAYLTDSLYWGFGIVAAFYIILLIVLIKFGKEPLQKFITNTIIEVVFDKSEPETNGNTDQQ